MADFSFEELLAASPLGVAVWSAHGPDPVDMVLEWANAQASTETGLDLAPFLGSRIVDAFPLILEGGQGQRPIDAAWRAAVTGEGSSSEFGYSDSRVPWRWLRAVYAPLDANLMAVFYENMTAGRSESALAALDAAVVIHAADTSNSGSQFEGPRVAWVT